MSLNKFLTIFIFIILITERKYSRWTEEETTLVQQHFHRYFDGGAETTLPGNIYLPSLGEIGLVVAML